MRRMVLPKLIPGQKQHPNVCLTSSLPEGFLKLHLQQRQEPQGEEDDQLTWKGVASQPFLVFPEEGGQQPQNDNPTGTLLPAWPACTFDKVKEGGQGMGAGWRGGGPACTANKVSILASSTTGNNRKQSRKKMRVGEAGTGEGCDRGGQQFKP